jgi:paraquat-inducible protein B
MSYLAYLQSELSEKKDQLNRLKTCVSELDVLQSEFIQDQKLTKDPVLTATTWKGTLADKFENIREDLSYSYKDISQIQLDTAITTIENKIDSINAEIRSLQQSIEAEKDRIEREERKERAERA